MSPNWIIHKYFMFKTKITRFQCELHVKHISTKQRKHTKPYRALESELYVITLLDWEWKKNKELNCLLKIDHNIVRYGWSIIMQCAAILIECQRRKMSSHMNWPLWFHFYGCNFAPFCRFFSVSNRDRILFHRKIYPTIGSYNANHVLKLLFSFMKCAMIRYKYLSNYRAAFNFIGHISSVFFVSWSPTFFWFICKWWL